MPTSGPPTPGRSTSLLDLGATSCCRWPRSPLGLVGGYSILMRSSIIDTRTEDYITTARAKGLTDGRILRTHAFPNALLPMVTLIAINLGYVVGGRDHRRDRVQLAGSRDAHVRRAGSRDFPVLQASSCWSVVVVMANFLADLLYGFLDPRVRR